MSPTDPVETEGFFTDELDESKKLPPAIIYEPTRHPLMGMEEKEPEYVTKLKEDLNLDQELGLKKQAAMDQTKTLRLDIDELTSSENFFEITRKQLDKLFQMGRLKRKVALANTVEIIVGTLKSIDYWSYLLAFLILLFTFTCIVCTRGWEGPVNWANGFLVTSFFVTGVLASVCICYLINRLNKKTVFEYTFLKVYMNIESLNDTMIEIPRGAKIKTVEAGHTKIFKDFVIARPDLEVENKSVSNFLPKITFDPAILGNTHDGRMFMIVWWDIKKDIEKVIHNIQRFKKFKLNG